MWLLPHPPRVSVSHVLVCVVYALVYMHVRTSVGTSMCVGVCVCVGAQPEVAVRRLLWSLSTLCTDIGSLKRTQKFWLVQSASSLPASLRHHPPQDNRRAATPQAFRHLRPPNSGLEASLASASTALPSSQSTCHSICKYL